MGTGQKLGFLAKGLPHHRPNKLSSPDRSTLGFYLTCPQPNASNPALSPTQPSNRRRFTPIRPFAHTPLPSPRSTSEFCHSFRLFPRPSGIISSWITDLLY